MMKNMGMRLCSLVMMALVLIPVVTHAHGGAEISVYPQSVAPGEALFVEGEDINPNGPIAIFLDGVQGRFRLGQAQGSEDGGFKINLTLPEDIPAGSYLLKAIGSSGTTASAEVAVTSAGNQASAPLTRIATAEEMGLNRSRSSGEWVGLVVFLGSSALLGIKMVWSRADRNAKKGTTTGKPLN